MVKFSHPFRLTALDTEQPAGTYRVVADEDEIPGLSFPAYRRSATMLHIPAVEISPLAKQVISIDQNELDEILAADARRA